MNKPNLFFFATSELSQDAFLCWLASWAAPGLDILDKPLHDAARAFIVGLFGACGQLPPACNSIKVSRQFEDIDVLLLIDNSFAVIIEDKTHGSDPAAKLNRYREVIKANKNYSAYTIVPVYLKTRDQSNYKSVQQAGYGYFVRQDMLKILSAAAQAGCTNNILLDFLAHPRKIEADIQSYKTTPVSQWSKSPESSCWKGFFIDLQKALKGGEWLYVNNPAGGFMGFHWGWKGELYLQLEHEMLCFKIREKDKAKQSQARDQAQYLFIQRVRTASNGLQIQKPGRLGKGEYMTFAFVQPYLQTDAGGILDFDATVDLLQKAQALL